jgi:hypothetical protein
MAELEGTVVPGRGAVGVTSKLGDLASRGGEVVAREMATQGASPLSSTSVTGGDSDGSAAQRAAVFRAVDAGDFRNKPLCGVD